jgi:hypothetical protein
LPVTGCGLCGRTVCGACISGGDLCATCRALTPARAEDFANLPAELAADGLAVLIGRDTGGSIALLVGEHRTEVAVYSSGGLHRWETARQEPPPALRIRIAGAKLTGAGDIGIWVADGAVSPLPEDALVLQRHGGTRVVWAVESDGHVRAGNTKAVPGSRSTDLTDPRLLEQLDLAMTEALGAAGSQPPIPEAATPARSEAIRRFARAVAAPGGGGNVVVSRQVTEASISIDGRGLVRRTTHGPVVTEQVAPWRTPDAPHPWAVDGWLPAPEIVAAANLDGYAAVLASVGDHALLGIRHDRQMPAWYGVTGPAWDDLCRVALGTALLGRPALLSVATITPPEALRGPALLGAKRESRRLWPDLVLTTGAQPGPTAIPPAEALARVLPHATVAAPNCRDRVPSALAGALRDRLDDHTLERVHGDIGLRVEDDWRLPTGELTTIGYRVPPGRVDGQMTDAVTGLPLRAAVVCREHHVVRHVETCSSCLTGTCGACPDEVRPCALCGDRLCGRCIATPDGRCGACAALRKVGVLSRGRLGVPRGAVGWQGQTPRVRVLVRLIDGEWWLDRWNSAGAATMKLDGDRLALAQEVLGRGNSVNR